VKRPTQAILACAALLGACASEQWVKDSGEIADRKVLSECSQQSMARAGTESMASGTFVSVQNNIGGPSGRTEFPRSQVPPPNTGIQEQAYFNLCMRERGYALAPAAER